MRQQKTRSRRPRFLLRQDRRAIGRPKPKRPFLRLYFFWRFEPERFFPCLPPCRRLRGARAEAAVLAPRFLPAKPSAFLAAGAACSLLAPVSQAPPRGFGRGCAFGSAACGQARSDSGEEEEGEAETESSDWARSWV